MVLRGHFLGNDSTKGGSSAMMLTVSFASGHFPAIMNTSEYENLVGMAGGEKRR